MTLSLPFQVKDSDTQNNFDEIAQHFPLQRKDLMRQTVSGGIVGATGAISFGKNFTCSRTGVGLYTITFTPTLSVIPAVTLTAVSWAAALIALPTTTGFQVNTFITTTGAASDRDWCFVATGCATD